MSEQEERSRVRDENVPMGPGEPRRAEGVPAGTAGGLPPTPAQGTRGANAPLARDRGAGLGSSPRSAESPCSLPQCVARVPGRTPRPTRGSVPPQNQVDPTLATTRTPALTWRPLLRRVTGKAFTRRCSSRYLFSSQLRIAVS